MTESSPIVLPERLEDLLFFLAAHQGLTVTELLIRLTLTEVQRTGAYLDPRIADLVAGPLGTRRPTP